MLGELSGMLERADGTVDDREAGFRVGVLRCCVLSSVSDLPVISERRQSTRHQRVAAFQPCLPNLCWDDLGRVGRPFAIPISVCGAFL